MTDPHGNVIQLTDESGAVIKTYEYDSFGNEVNPAGKDENPFRYCGEYYDKETEEIYLRARYYQSAVGRFLTRDTYTGEDDEPLSLHLYTYCGNDGVNNVDPSGHCWNKGKWNYKCKHYNRNPKKISNDGISFIEEVEGFKSNVYNAGDGKRTIGFGHVLQENENISYIKRGEAEKLLKKDLSKKSQYNKKLRKYLKKEVKIHVHQNQYDAMVSLAYNVGDSVWTNGYSPKFTKLLKKGKLDKKKRKKKIIKQFISYDHMYNKKKKKMVENKGLWRRHLNEGLLFTTGEYNNYGFEQLNDLGWKFKEEKRK